LTERVLALLIQGADVNQLETEADAIPAWQVDPALDLLAGLRTQPLAVALFLSNGLRLARSLRAEALDQEPALVAWSLDEDDPLRERAAAVEPAYALRGLGCKPLEPNDLRLQLFDRAPESALSSLKYLDDPRIDEFRLRLADALPGAVAASLTSREDDFAETLRDRCWSNANADEHATSLAFCSGERAWSRRLQLLEKDPIAALDSLRGVAGPRADAILERHAALAPRPVVRALSGRRDDRAYAFRQTLFSTGREIIDSLRGLDEPAAWQLRERALPLWPSTVIHSLEGTPTQEKPESLRREAVIGKGLAVGRGDLHVQRRLSGLDEYPDRPVWARHRKALTQSEE
jgi:hypothetical protein